MRTNEILVILLLRHKLRFFGGLTIAFLLHLVNTWWQLIKLFILLLAPDQEIRTILQIILLNIMRIIALLAEIVIRNLGIVLVTVSKVRLPVRNILLSCQHILKGGFQIVFGLFVKEICVHINYL